MLCQHKVLSHSFEIYVHQRRPLLSSADWAGAAGGGEQDLAGDLPPSWGHSLRAAGHSGRLCPPQVLRRRDFCRTHAEHYEG